MKVFPDHEKLQVNILDERFYQSPTDEEKYYPGATTILDVWPKSQLYSWFKDVGHNADYIVQKAAEEGSRVHDAIQLFHLGDPIMMQNSEGLEYSILEWGMITKFMQWYYRYNPEAIAVEKVLVSDKLEFGGMLDYVCRFNDEVWLIDYKTSNSIWKEHAFQIAAYARLLAEYGIKIDRAGILHLKAKTRKEGELQGVGWKLYDITDKLSSGFNMFLHAQAIWKEENPNFKPKNKIMPLAYKKDEPINMELLYGTRKSDN